MFRKNINLTLPHIIVEYAKVIKGRFKAHQREEGLRIVVDLWNSNVDKVKGLKGFVLMTDSDDSQGATNTTVWESKQEWIRTIQTTRIICRLWRRLGQ